MRLRAAVLAEPFGLRRKSMPCQMTSCNVLARVDAKHLDELLAAFCVRWEAKPRCGTEPSRLHTPAGRADHTHLAIDGKTLGGTTSQPPPVHQLRCYEVATGIVLWHCDVQEKEHESSALKPLLTPHLIKACQTRTGPVPGLLAQLNSTVLCLMHRAGVRNVARQMRSFDAHPEQALALVLTGSCFVYENWKALLCITIVTQSFIMTLRDYLRFYNEQRIHQALDDQTPAEVYFARR